MRRATAPILDPNNKGNIIIRVSALLPVKGAARRGSGSSEVAGFAAWMLAEPPAQTKATPPHLHPKLPIKLGAGMVSRHPAGRNASPGAEKELQRCPADVLRS